VGFRARDRAQIDAFWQPGVDGGYRDDGPRARALSTARRTTAGSCSRVDVSAKVRQPFGLVHGGVDASITESLATLGTIEGIEPGQAAVGLYNYANFLRPVREGSLHATASAGHRGRTTWVWDVQIHDDRDRVCALTRMTIAVPSTPPGAIR
jgi:uncharacterized protein (TIGR00369 family)